MNDVIAEWLNQLRACNKRVQTALAVLAIFGCALFLTILADFAQRRDASEKLKAGRAAVDRVDNAARNVYLNLNLETTGSSSGDAGASIDGAVSDDLRLLPTEWGLTAEEIEDITHHKPAMDVRLSLQRLYDDLSDYQSERSELIKNRVAGTQYSQLDPDQRNEICKMVLFCKVFGDEQLGAQYVESKKYASALESLAVERINGEVKLQLDIPALTGVTGSSSGNLGNTISPKPFQTLKVVIDQINLNDTMDLDALGAFMGPDGSLPITTSVSQNYISLTDTLSTYEASAADLAKSDTLSIPVVGVTLKLAVVGFLTFAANLLWFGYLLSLQTQMSRLVKMLDNTDAKRILISSIVADCPLVSGSNEIRLWTDPLLLSATTIVACAYQADLGNIRTLIFLIGFALVVFGLNIWLKLLYHNLANADSMCDCLFGSDKGLCQKFECRHPSKDGKPSCG